jgi:hypothetical protein
MRKAFEGGAIAIAQVLRDGLCQTLELRHSCIRMFVLRTNVLYAIQDGKFCA